MSFFAGTEAAVWGVQLEMTTRVTYVDVTNRLGSYGEYKMVFVSSTGKSNSVYFQSSLQITAFCHWNIAISLRNEVSDDLVYHGTVYDMIWYEMIWNKMIWYDMVWYGMVWYDMIWYDIWYDMIWYDMI